MEPWTAKVHSFLLRQFVLYNLYSSLFSIFFDSSFLFPVVLLPSASSVPSSNLSLHSVSPFWHSNRWNSFSHICLTLFPTTFSGCVQNNDINNPLPPSLFMSCSTLCFLKLLQLAKSSVKCLQNLLCSRMWNCALWKEYTEVSKTK